VVDPAGWYVIYEDRDEDGVGDEDEDVLTVEIETS
jgi:hypothetical protein